MSWGNFYILRNVSILIAIISVLEYNKLIAESDMLRKWNRIKWEMSMSFFIISLKQKLNYRWDIIFSIINILLVTVITIFLWKYIYRDSIVQREYMICYTILSSCISLFYTTAISDRIAEKVYKGTFVVDLIRPIDFLKINYLQVMGEVAASVLEKGIPVLVILGLWYHNCFKMIQLTAALAGVMALLSAFILHMNLFAVIGFLSFKFFEVWPFNRLLRDTIRFFSGAFIPLALFPGWLYGVTKFLPFQYLYSFPIRLILGDVDIRQVWIGFFVLIFWIVVSSMVLLWFYKRAIRKCVVQGG